MKIPYKRSLIVALAFCVSEFPTLDFPSSKLAAQTFSGQQDRLPQPTIGRQTANALPPIVTQSKLPPIVTQSQIPPVVSGTGNSQQNDFAIQGNFVPPITNGTGNSTSVRSGALKPLKPQASPHQGFQANNREDVPMFLPSGPTSPGAPRTVSTSGVPFYKPQPTNQDVAVELPAVPDKAAKLPTIQPGSIQEIQPAPRSNQPATAAPNLTQGVQGTQQPQSAPRATAPRATTPRTMAPRSSVPPQTMETVLDNSVPQQQNQPTQLPLIGSEQVNQAPMAAEAPMPGYFDSNSNQNMTPGCMDCVASGGASNCPTCNQNGYGSGYGNGMDGGMGGGSSKGYFGAMSQARRYVELDALFMTRTDGTIVFSNFGGLGSFDWNLGWRATIGTRFDETQGREFSYFGTAGIEKDITRTSAAGQLSALFTPSTLFAGALTDPFFDANLQNEAMETQIHSVEFNKVTWAWDVVKSFVGIRYIYLDDSYSLTSQRGANVANYNLESLNNLIGVHIGRELFYDVGYRMSLSGLAKAGVYANANRFEANATTNGTRFVDNVNDSSTISTSLDLHLTGHYQINRRSRFRMGYQAMLLDEVFSVSDNITGGLSPFTGALKPSKDSMFIHGFNFGIEIYR